MDSPLQRCQASPRTRPHRTAIRASRSYLSQFSLWLCRLRATFPAIAGDLLTALLRLLSELALEGRVLTIDTMGCRTDIARTITDAGGWYLPAVKDNESGLQRDFVCLDRPVPWPTTDTRPWSGGTAGLSGAPARPWAALTASWRESIPTNAGRCRALLHA
ncbi:MAG: hypothetical protein F4X16_05515 [Caldilineaceae bacterium SB0661_bin_34]|nr:hypothetical protein [Caldilineaceae bacterium SB0661_bin_34]